MLLVSAFGTTECKQNWINVNKTGSTEFRKKKLSAFGTIGTILTKHRTILDKILIIWLI